MKILTTNPSCPMAGHPNLFIRMPPMVGETVLEKWKRAVANPTIVPGNT